MDMTRHKKEVVQAGGKAADIVGRSASEMVPVCVIDGLISRSMKWYRAA